MVTILTDPILLIV